MGEQGSKGDEWLRFNHVGEAKGWTGEADRSDEWLRSYSAGEGKRWTNEASRQMGGGD